MLTGLLTGFSLVVACVTTVAAARSKTAEGNALRKMRTLEAEARTEKAKADILELKVFQFNRRIKDARRHHALMRAALED